VQLLKCIERINVAFNRKKSSILKYNAFAITNAYNGHNEISYVNFNSGRRVLANLNKKMYCSVCPMTRRSRQNYFRTNFRKNTH
jgi:hypothetical protein